MHDEIDLGTRIAAWRRAKGLTQRELADRLGLTAAAVYQWEGTGEQQVRPSLKNLEALVDALGITMERFYGRLPRETKAS